MKTTFNNIEKICLEFNSIPGMEYGVLYKMPPTMKIETPNGFKQVKGFIKKNGKEAKVTLVNGSIIHAIGAHLVSTSEGIKSIYDLDQDSKINTTHGLIDIEKIELFDNMIDVFDLSVDSDDQLYVTANGIIHHNTGKTQTVEDTLEELGLTDGSGYFKVTGSASPSAVYETLYKNRRGVILFDDCDGALDSQDGRNLIKAATDTKSVRKVSWMKKSKAYYDPAYEAEPEDEEGNGDGDIDDRLPRYFDFMGKVIFISNLSMRKLDPDGALKTRGMMIELNPTNMEMYQFMELIYNKVKLAGENELSMEKRKEVVHTLRDIISKAPEMSVNLRLLVRALNLAATGLPDWSRMLRYA